MSDSSSTLDFAVLNELRDILDEELHELLDEYLLEVPRQLEQLRGGVEGNDLYAIATIAHSIKGSSGNLGVTGLYQLCARLEQEAKLGDVTDSYAALAAIEREFSEAKMDIAHYLAG